MFLHDTVLDRGRGSPVERKRWIAGKMVNICYNGRERQADKEVSAFLAKHGMAVVPKGKTALNLPDVSVTIINNFFQIQSFQTYCVCS